MHRSWMRAIWMFDQQYKYPGTRYLGLADVDASHSSSRNTELVKRNQVFRTPWVPIG